MRLDVPACAAALGLTYLGPCPGGEVGAGYVLLPDGRRAVLTSGNAASARLVPIARAAGVPAPRYERVAGVAGVTVVVQEFLPGASPAVTDSAVVDAMLAVSARCAGLLRDSGLPPRQLYLHRDGPGFCQHGSLAGHSARSAELLARVRAVPMDVLPGDDLVHFDFHPGNVLVSPTAATVAGTSDALPLPAGDAGVVVTGVVDWDGAGRGNRAFDLVTLLFVLSRQAPHLTPPVRDAALALAPAEVLAACWAHMSLRQVDWSIRHHTAAEVDAWLAVAETDPWAHR
ncbi:phosphotransferase [Dactylosporangium sp. NPDC000521]|uniref:phosphotransferase n=1 Tax=Dactylosporangium sp. NPDC000521 TaxID=3363975 RepID=UPI003681CC63